MAVAASLVAWAAGPWPAWRAGPAQPPGRAVAVSAAAAAVVAGVWVLVRWVDVVGDGDTGAARWARAHATPGTDRVMHAISDLGGTTGLVVVGVPVAVVMVRRTRTLWVVAFLVAVRLGDSWVTTLVKHWTGRPRPTLTVEAASLGPAFPSGHSSAAAACYGAMALLLMQVASLRGRRILCVAAAAVPAAVAASRVLLGVHWVSDVVAGLALGWAWCALCTAAFARVLPVAR